MIVHWNRNFDILMKFSSPQHFKLSFYLDNFWHNYCWKFRQDDISISFMADGKLRVSAQLLIN